MSTKVATGRVTKAKKEKSVKKSNVVNPWLNFLSEYRALNDPAEKTPNWLTLLMRDAGVAYKALPDSAKQKYKMPLAEFKEAAKIGKGKEVGKMDTANGEEEPQSASSSPAQGKENKKGRKK